MNFLASPEIVTAMAFSGELSFNPMQDSLISADGKPFKFEPPSGSMLPAEGFTSGPYQFKDPGYLLLIHQSRLMSLIGRFHSGNR